LSRSLEVFWWGYSLKKTCNYFFIWHISWLESLGKKICCGFMVKPSEFWWEIWRIKIWGIAFFFSLDWRKFFFTKKFQRKKICFKTWVQKFSFDHISSSLSSHSTTFSKELPRRHFISTFFFSSRNITFTLLLQYDEKHSTFINNLLIIQKNIPLLLPYTEISDPRI